jgi:DNA segregation ATPase FtsK/SpoIIIE, S-DNA-T family
MAKKPLPSKENKAEKPSPEKGRDSALKNFVKDERTRKITGAFLLALSAFLFVAMVSHHFAWKHDQSLLRMSSEEIAGTTANSFGNTMGRVGAWVSHLLVFRGLGTASLGFPFLLFLLGYRILFRKHLLKPGKSFRIAVFLMLWLTVVLALITTRFVPGVDGFEKPICGECLGGMVGFSLYLRLKASIGLLGVVSVLLLSAFAFATIHFNEKMTALWARFSEWWAKATAKKEKPAAIKPPVPEGVIEEPNQATVVDFDKEAEEKALLDAIMADTLNNSDEEDEEDFEDEIPQGDEEMEVIMPEPETQPDATDLEVETAEQEEELSEDELEDLVKEFGEYDPKLDLSRYELPPIDLLEAHGSGQVQINMEELEANKRRIVETLNNYNIEIAKIKATVGPTVTLYEIVPAPGVRISKIKNLEDDIALSLAALGIRIIAPIPGKGTIGIEVPNSKPEIVSMRSLIASEKFQHSEMDLPVVLGKTISNENFVVDLAKMPHLLMAGATGQGKSVGLNAILVSLLYKKHPSQIKFVLVDPKKVELTLFTKIERHFLAKLPNEEEAIITDTSKVVQTLNSLCVEMDDRYELLKLAQCRNLKEYNAKFIKRKLNPENGHRYLPYIVLVVDEFADLIMTAGKEVETPIARLAQLARAIGIHLIIATQRPSVNIITGTIKANFPARIAFRVTSKIDSRTILDAGGADQLIGRGDMLYSTGNDLVRVQCGFVDTPEVDKICDFIGNQQGYPTAFMLPEYVDENSSEFGDLDDSDRDELFEDAARIVVMHQQGSASLLQRKLKLGYNRAGRLIDQLEQAGVIGPFKGSKAREVLISDEVSLEQFLARRQS